MLAVLKQKQPGSGNIASSTNDVQKSIRSLTRLVEVSNKYNNCVVMVMEIQELVPKQGHDAETLGDILEEEMTATALVSNTVTSLAQ